MPVNDTEGYITQIRGRSPDWFDLADDVARYASDLISQLSVEQENDRDLVAAILYRRLVSALEAIIILAERGMHTEGQCVQRSMLEGLFVLGAVWKEPKTIEAFFSNDSGRVKKVLKNIKEISGPIREAVANSLTFEEIERRIATIGNPSVKSAKDFAKDAGLLDLYLTDYSFSSEALHHVAKDLERHIDKSGSGNVDGLFWGPEAEQPFELLSPAINYVLLAIEAVRGVFNLDSSQLEEGLRVRMDRLFEMLIDGGG